MKKLLVGIVVLVALLVSAAVIVPMFVPLDAYKGEITSRATAATGRDVRIDGPIRLTVLPRLSIELNNVALANAPGGTAKELATIGKLQLQLGLLPLLSRQIVVDRFVVSDPAVALEIDAQGRPNWQLGTATPAQAAPAAAARPQAAPAQPGGTVLSDLRLGDIRLVGGRMSYSDKRSGQSVTIEKINMTLSLPSLEQPLAAEGGLTWNGKEVAVSLNAAKPRELLKGGTSGIGLHIASEPITFGFQGEMSAATPLRMDGALDLGVPSVRGLAAWTGHPLQAQGTAAGNTLGAFSLKGKLALAGPRVAMTDASIAFDAIKATGEVAVDTGNAKPMIKGRLDVDRLDLNPYLASTTSPPAGATAGTTAPAQPAPAAATRTAEWSDAPIDLSGLKAANADLSLSAGSLQFQKISIGKSLLGVLLQDGKLTADLKELALYQGNGQGRVALDGSGAVPGLDANFKLANVAAEPLLRDAMEIERLSGTGAFDVTLNSHGRSQRELIGALGGKGALAFTNGAIKGINLAAMVRNVSTAFAEAASNKPQQTDFAELGGTFTIVNGIVHNDDLDLKSPLLRLAGAGTVDLPQRTIDYRVTPKVVANLEGQGGAGDAGGIMVPIIVQGPLTAPSYKPDLAAMLQQRIDPSKLLQGLKPGAIPGTAGSSPPAASGQSQKPADLLKGLLGGKKN
jgi:AsmA protein